MIKRTSLRGVLASAFLIGSLAGMRQPVQADAIASLPDVEWRRDAALQAKVSFEAMRQTLPQVLAVLQERSGVPLKIAADSPAAGSLLTARANQLPLVEVMQSLSHLYGVRWEKQGNTFVMSGRDISEVDFAVRRVGGEQGMLISNAYFDAIRQRSVDLSAEIYGGIDKQQWEEPTGVPVAALPEALQERLGDHFHRAEARGMLHGRRVYDSIVNADPVVRLGRIDKNITDFDRELGFVGKGGRSALYLLSSDGRLVMPLFEEFSGPISDTSANDSQLQQKQKRIHDLEDRLRGRGGP